MDARCSGSWSRTPTTQVRGGSALVVLERGWPDARNSLLHGPALLVANDGAFT